MINIASGIAGMEINGVAEPLNSTDTYDAMGDFAGTFNDKGQIHFIGTAQLLWKNDVRRNPTKWESLSESYTSILLGAMTAMCALGLRIFMLRLKNDPDLSI
jgi:hypothetical protein